MKFKLVTSFALVVGFLMVCGSMFAHHGSGVSYDMKKQVTLTGTVTAFAWSNPHVYIMYDVKDDGGNVTHWGAETHDPGALAKRNGWNKNTLKPGDQVTVTVFPSKADTPRGLLAKLVLKDKVLLDDTERGTAE